MLIYVLTLDRIGVNQSIVCGLRSVKIAAIAERTAAIDASTHDPHGCIRIYHLGAEPLKRGLGQWPHAIGSIGVL